MSNDIVAALPGQSLNRESPQLDMASPESAETKTTTNDDDRVVFASVLVNNRFDNHLFGAWRTTTFCLHFIK